MKKILLMAIMAVSLSLVSCSKDSDDNYSPSDIVGEWYLTQENGYYYWYGERESYDESFAKANTWLYWIFSSDGTAFAKNVEDQDDPLLFSLTWSISGNKLTMKENGSSEAEVATIQKLTSSTLKIQAKGTDEDGPYEYNYTFVKVN